MKIFNCFSLRRTSHLNQKFAVKCYNKLYWPKQYLWHAFLFLKGQKKIILVDDFGRYRFLTLSSLLFQSIPALLFSGLIALYVYLLIVLLLILERLKRNDLVKLDKVEPAGKKVLFLRTDDCYGINAGGSFAHLGGVYSALRRQKMKIKVYSTDFFPFFDQENFSLIRPSSIFGTFSELPELAINLFYFKIKNNTKKQNFSFIYHRYSFNNFLGLIVAKKNRCLLVLEYNGSETWVRKNWGDGVMFDRLSTWIEEISLSRAQKIVVVSENLKIDLVERGFDKRKILVNPNGVDVEEYNPCINGELIREKYSFFDDEVIIGFIGTFGPWHGVELLIKAFAQVLKEKTEVRAKLLLIGNGDRFEDCHLMVKDLDIESKVVFTGIVPQAEGKKYLAACDILTLPIVPNADGSKFFGSPTKLFEYMAMGKAIISSDFAQMGEILEHEEDAYLFEPSNISDLSRTIKMLVSDASLRAKLGENARKKVVEYYSWDRHVEKILNFIQT